MLPVRQCENIIDMKRCIILAIVTLLSFAVEGQEREFNISVTSARGENVTTFLSSQMVGEGVHLYNVRHNGVTDTISYDNIGTFQRNSFPGLSMDKGMVLTTGNVNVAVGPNNSTNKEINAGGYIDTVLYLFSGENVRTCSALDFDFVSLGTQISVRYLFGSEEYPEYVCTQFNDIFAFLVTGTDPATGRVCTRNIVIIPSTQDENNPNGIPVSINSVNQGSGGNPNMSGCYYDYSEYYIENVYESGIQYDGYTHMLSAQADILPSEIYHMHISVCNVGDGAYGSGVFLDGKSFRALEINPKYCQAWSTDRVDTIAPNNHPRIEFDPLYVNLIEAQVDFTFVGANNMIHFNCERDDGTVVTNVDPHLYLTENSSTVLTFSPILNRLPATPMPLQIILLTHGRRINAGGDTTNVMLYDTLSFVLTSENISSGNMGGHPVDAQKVKIYPNPATNMLYIEGTDLRRLDLYDDRGIVVLSKTLQGNNAQVDISAISYGSYMVKITTTVGENTELLIKE